MVTMAERIKGLEKDVGWIKDTNKQQNENISSILHKLEDFIETSNTKFACKNTEQQVQQLMYWRYYIAGAFAIIIIIISYINWG